MLIFTQGVFVMVAKGRGGGKTPPRVSELLINKVSTSSQAAVSRDTGLTRQTIQRYMAGIGEPSNATLQKLADYFNITIQELRGVDAIELTISTQKISVDYNLVKLTGVEFILLFDKSTTQNEFNAELSSIIARLLRDLNRNHDIAARENILTAFTDFEPNFNIFEP
jgi:transcriptional regulator with XRE-family HTH domain